MGLQPTRAWSIQGNVSSVRARFDNFRQNGVSVAGKTPPNTPAVVANLWTSYAFAPGWQVSAGLRHVGKVYADAANTQQWPAYTLLDLGLSYQVQRNVSVVARLRNATNRLYAANLTSAMAYLGAARTADLTLRITY
ncbi:catecholate siderophore receptor Fiu [compost metagenome]